MNLYLTKGAERSDVLVCGCGRHCGRFTLQRGPCTSARYHRLGARSPHPSQVEEEFAPRWEAGQVAGWEDRGVPAAPSASGLELEAFSSAEELEILGADRLKEALTQLGLKCGGTTKDRAARLWLTRDTPLEKLDRKHFAKGVVPPCVAADPAAAAKATAQARAVGAGQLLGCCC